MPKNKPPEDEPFYKYGEPDTQNPVDEGKANVSRMIEEAEPVAGGARIIDHAPGHQKYGHRPGEWRAAGFMDKATGLPVDCPVTALGYDDDQFWFIDTVGQVRVISAGKFSRNLISSLFMMRTNWLHHHWPKKRDGKEVTGLSADKVTDDLMAACATKGSWNDVEMVRGRGCWRDLEGQLMVHCGDRLVVPGGEIDLGEHDGFVYPSRKALPAPLSGYDPAIHPGEYLLTLLRKWDWKRPDIDPILALGQIGASFLSGALDWRPSTFITGDKATGKTTVQKVFKGVLGGWLIQAADTTAAGIYQRVKHDALPVSVDELESERDPVKQKNILKLARLSSQGSLMLRGGSEGKGSEFNARSCFMFSSINHPPLEPQDLSRMAMLSLNKIKKGAPKLDVNMQELAVVGRRCLGKLIDNWERFEITLEDYQHILANAGHDGRGQDTFGTLLACADLLIDEKAEKLGVAMGNSDLTPWADLLQADRLAEYEGAEENWRLCLTVILTTPIDAWRGGSRNTVGEMIDEFWRSNTTDIETGDLDYSKMRKELAAAGLSVKKPNRASLEYRLFIPHQNPALQRLFMGQKWYGEPGAGVWSGALQQGPPDWVQGQQTDRISGWKCKGVSIPLAKICENLMVHASDEGLGYD